MYYAQLSFMSFFTHDCLWLIILSVILTWQWKYSPLSYTKKKLDGFLLHLHFLLSSHLIHHWSRWLWSWKAYLNWLSSLYLHYHNPIPNPQSVYLRLLKSPGWHCFISTFGPWPSIPSIEVRNNLFFFN